MTGPVSAAAIAAGLRPLGHAITPDMIGGTHALYVPLHPAPGEVPGVRVLRDRRYGPDERNRLDVFLPEQGSAPRGALLFVHGGGFVGGDKTAPGKPFYDNVGRWAVAHGLIGVTMTYRLAPAHRWPSGSDDVGRAVQWLKKELPAFGGDPARICAMGQSAGAVHVAGFAARAPAAERPASLVLVSGLFDARTMERNVIYDSYFDAAASERESFLAPLAALELPMLVLAAELDPPDFQKQAARLLDACAQANGVLPRFVQLAGHNHLSPVLGLGAVGDARDPPDTLGPVLAGFLARAG